MMFRIRIMALALSAMALELLSTRPALGFGGKMHAELTTKTEKNSSYFAKDILNIYNKKIKLDYDVFKEETYINDDKNTNLAKSTSWNLKMKGVEWLKLGSGTEDSPLGRARFHFHDSVKKEGWTEAGLNNQGEGFWDDIIESIVENGTDFAEPFLGHFDLTGKSALLWALFNNTGISNPEPEGDEEERNVYDFSKNQFNIWKSKRYLYIALTGDKNMDGIPDPQTDQESYYEEGVRSGHWTF